MRVLLLTDSDVLAGTERHMLDLAVALRAAGAAVSIGCPAAGALAERAAGEGLCILPVEKGGAIDWQTARAVAGPLRAGALDLVHAHNGRTALVGAMATGLAGRGALVVTQHFVEPSRVGRVGLKGLASRAVHGWLGRQVDRFIAVSMAAREGMIHRGDCEMTRISIVPNGIRPPIADGAAGRARTAVRAELGVSAARPLIACVARLEPEKDVATLVEAMVAVRNACPPALCVIAGDGGLRDQIEGRIADLGLRDHVRLLGFRSDAAAIMAACDLFVLPSRNESFGLVIAEAMALGRPVVATNAGGPAEVVVDGQTGTLVPPGSPPAMASAIVDLLRDEPRRLLMGQAGHARYLERFTATRMAAQTMHVYRQVLAARAAGRRSWGLLTEVSRAAR